jgi:hypothetical protein
MEPRFLSRPPHTLVAKQTDTLSLHVWIYLVFGNIGRKEKQPQFFLNTRRWAKSKNPVILSVPLFPNSWR